MHIQRMLQVFISVYVFYIISIKFVVIYIYSIYKQAVKIESMQ